MTLISLLLFPVTMNWLSPYVSLDGAMAGVVSGSVIVFAALFIISIFFGRAWCAWVCPMAGLSDISIRVNGKRVNAKKLRIVRYTLFTLWFGFLAAGFVLAGGIKGIDPLHLTESGISVDEPMKYVVYYGVLAIFIVLTFSIGRRGACHSICWMAPFMAAGYTVGRLLKIRQLRVTADSSKCTSCGTCSRNCPMSIDVQGCVKAGKVITSDCILCGECVDSCPKSALAYKVTKL